MRMKPPSLMWDARLRTLPILNEDVMTNNHNECPACAAGLPLVRGDTYYEVYRIGSDGAKEKVWIRTKLGSELDRLLHTLKSCTDGRLTVKTRAS